MTTFERISAKDAAEVVARINARSAANIVRRKAKRPEDTLQRAVCAYLDVLQSQSKLLYFAVPNGGKRAKIEAFIMKGLGVKAGVPDLCIVPKTGPVLFIELKSPDGRVSESQTEWLFKLSEFGCPTTICRNLDEVTDFLAIHGLAPSAP